MLFLDVFSNHELHITKFFFFVNSYQDCAIIFTGHQIGSDDVVKLWQANQVIFHIWAISYDIVQMIPIDHIIWYVMNAIWLTVGINLNYNLWIINYDGSAETLEASSLLFFSAALWNPS